jgi:hypothetical protein
MLGRRCCVYSRLTQGDSNQSIPREFKLQVREFLIGDEWKILEHACPDEDGETGCDVERLSDCAATPANCHKLEFFPVV